jgi:hypothetical protein
MYRTIAALLVCAGTMVDARAALYTFEFSGKINSAWDSANPEADAFIDPLGGIVSTNSVFHGTFSIDSDTPLTKTEEPSDDRTERTYQSGSINNTVQNNHMSVRFDQSGYIAHSGTGPTASSYIQTLDSKPPDYYGPPPYETFYFAPAPASGTHGKESMSFFILDFSEYLISSQLPGNLVVTETSVFSYQFTEHGTGREVSLYGYLDTLDLRSITLVPVPEPSTYAMLALGLLTVGAASYRQKRRG